MKKSFIFLILTILLIGMVGCSPDSTNTNTDNVTTTQSTTIVPTGPTSDSWVTLEVPVLLKDILGFDLKDVNAMTIIKYEDNTRTATVRVDDEKKIAEIANAISEFSVIHTKADPADPPVVYEISYSSKTSPQGLVSIQSMANKNAFSVGGSFIGYNKLSPIQPLLQSNAEISFGDIQKILEALLEK